VGIGTTTDPGTKLEVNGPIRTDNEDAALELHDSDGDNYRGHNWSDVFCIKFEKSIVFCKKTENF
jgi:hypothetical protein